MDTSAAEIEFDSNGVCNFCTEFLSRSGDVLAKESDRRNSELSAFVEKVKADGAGLRYDCIVGVSGGVDSSWVLARAVGLGLRPLAVHLDNGWDSEAAQNNIANLIQGLKVDLFTYVIDWHEYRALMQAFIDADVVDIELLMDNAMLRVVYQQAAKHKVRYILAGTNQSTEGTQMPKDWNWFKFDRQNIKSIARAHGGVNIVSFPDIGFFRYVWYAFVRNVRWVSFIDFFDYKKDDALQLLVREFSYKPYPFKHYESVLTRFYQGYILPTKFGIDKRRLHFSTLITTGQMLRIDALSALDEIPYESLAALEDDKKYFIKKMDWTPNQLVEYIARPGRSHRSYPSEKPLWDFVFGGSRLAGIRQSIRRLRGRDG